MHVLFYSTSSIFFDPKTIVTKRFPTAKQELEILAKNFPEHRFTVATQLPGMFFLDLNGTENFEKAPEIRYEIIKTDREEETADFLSSLNPDVAIAATFFTAPFDWLTAKDALVAQFLRKKGIRTVCHSLQTALICFDKWHTHQTLLQLGVNTPKALYVNHALFINAGNRKTIKSNVYKTALLSEIKDLRFPVVIKDTTGLSSYGMDVLENFGQVQDWLRSKKFTSDRIIEEFIKGGQFGAEIEASPKKNGKREIRILPPLAFSVNRWGITSPKQSVKTGPVTAGGCQLEQLKDTLEKIARALEFEGLAQIDLVFDGEKWFVIEINPRLSGMTETCSVMEGKSLFERLLKTAGIEKKDREGQAQKTNFVLNIKFPLLTDEEFARLSKTPCIKKLYQIENLAARQEREKGYCEAVIAADTKEQLQKEAETLAEVLPEKTERAFFDAAANLMAGL